MLSSGSISSRFCMTAFICALEDENQADKTTGNWALVQTRLYVYLFPDVFIVSSNRCQRFESTLVIIKRAQISRRKLIKFVADSIAFIIIDRVYYSTGILLWPRLSDEHITHGSPPLTPHLLKQVWEPSISFTFSLLYMHLGEERQ